MVATFTKKEKLSTGSSRGKSYKPNELIWLRHSWQRYCRLYTVLLAKEHRSVLVAIKVSINDCDTKYTQESIVAVTHEQE